MKDSKGYPFDFVFYYCASFLLNPPIHSERGILNSPPVKTIGENIVEILGGIKLLGGGEEITEKVQYSIEPKSFQFHPM